MECGVPPRGGGDWLAPHRNSAGAIMPHDGFQLRGWHATNGPRPSAAARTDAIQQHHVRAPCPRLCDLVGHGAMPNHQPTQGRHLPAACGACLSVPAETMLASAAGCDPCQGDSPFVTLVYACMFIQHPDLAWCDSCPMKTPVWAGIKVSCYI